SHRCARHRGDLYKRRARRVGGVAQGLDPRAFLVQLALSDQFLIGRRSRLADCCGGAFTTVAEEPLTGGAMRKLFIILASLAVRGAAAGTGLHLLYPVQVSILGGRTRNYILSWSAPAGTTTMEANAAYKAVTPASASPNESPPANAAGDWPSYNRTLASE